MKRALLRFLRNQFQISAVSKSKFRQDVEAVIQQRHSKVHPWSEAWVTGGLSKRLLGEWVKQHFHYVSHFPWWCATVYANTQNQTVQRKIG